MRAATTVSALLGVDVCLTTARRGLATTPPLARRFSAAHAHAPLACRGGSGTPSTSDLSMVAVPLTHARRTAFLGGLFGRSNGPKIQVDNIAFDKETTRYRGTLFGLPADNVMFYAKVGAGVLTSLVVVYIFFKGYVLLSRFSLQTVARMGFVGGFLCCGIAYTTTIAVLRRSHINANAVYNQSISLVMSNEKVQQFLGSHPRTGEFKTYCASGGFKLPLLRRIRSGSYELADLLALKQRRLQMLFILKNPSNGHEGVVSCDVRKESTGFMSSTNVFKSLSITLTDPVSKTAAPESIIIIGRPEDVIYAPLIR